MTLSLLSIFFFMDTYLKQSVLFPTIFGGILICFKLFSVDANQKEKKKKKEMKSNVSLIPTLWKFNLSFPASLSVHLQIYT